MKENKKSIIDVLRFYLLATELKDKIRRGWLIWNIDRKNGVKIDFGHESVEML